MTRPDYCPVAQEPCQAMCALSDVRCKIRDTPPAAPVQEPVNWSVYNSGAEVASGLTFSEAWEYMTPERLARQWCAVCVVDQSNMPVSTPAAQRQWVGLTDEEIHDIYDQLAKQEPYGVAVTRRNVGRAIEAKLKETNT